MKKITVINAMEINLPNADGDNIITTVAEFPQAFQAHFEMILGKKLGPKGTAKIQRHIEIAIHNIETLDECLAAMADANMINRV